MKWIKTIFVGLYVGIAFALALCTVASAFSGINSFIHDQPLTGIEQIALIVLLVVACIGGGLWYYVDNHN